MKKRVNRRMSILTALLMVFQLLLPSLNNAATAEAASTMLPPSNLAVQKISPEDIKLTWSAVFGATGYNVSGIVDGQIVPIGTTKTTSYAINDLPQGSYRYVVSTLNGTEESGPSAPVSVDIVYPAMASPATLNFIILNGNDIRLTWTASEYAESYKIYEIKADGQAVLVNLATGLSYTLVNVPAGTHKYAVASLNSKYGESPLLTPVQVDVVYPVMTAPATFTDAISNINTVTLKWAAVTYATGYKIYQIVNGEKTLKDTVTGTSVAYINLPAGDYIYEIHSYSDRFGESADSKQVSFNIDTVTMAPPGNFAYTIKNGNDIALTWTAAANATNYNIYQIIDGQKVLKSTVTGTAITYTNMPAGDYSYVIHSKSDRFGESTDGSQLTFTLAPVVMAAPPNATFNIQNINDVVLTWGAVQYAGSYKVYQVVDGEKFLKSTVTGTTVTYTKLPAGNYTYEIHSVSTRFGESPEGSKVSLTVGTQEILPPANLAYKIQNGNDLVLTWDAAANADSYKIYQLVNGQKVLKSTVTGTGITYTNMPAGDYSYVVYSNSARFGESADGSQLTFTLAPVVMAAPPNATFNIQNINDVVLTWGAVQYAGSYKVYQVVDGQKFLKSTVTGTTVTYTKLPAGNYTYEIHSVSTRFGESPEGSQVSLTVSTQEMLPPANLAYKIQNGNDLVLTWDAAANADSYKIYQLVNGQKVLKSTVTGTGITYTNMPAGDYSYVVYSNSARFGESADGSQLTFTLAPVVMAAPPNATFNIQNINDVVLTWGAVQYAGSYKVYQVVDGQKFLKSTVTGTTVTYTKLPAGNYTYEIHSVSTRFGESPEGSQVSLTVGTQEMQPPANLAYKIQNGNDLVLTWDAAANADSYKVYQLLNGQKVLKSTLTGTTVTYVNLPAGDYSYEVYSYSSRFGQSANVSPISVSVVFPVMAPPTNLVQKILGATQFSLSWDAALYASSYKVYQITGGQKVLKSTVNGTTVTYSNMAPGNYTFEVHSVSARFGESPEGTVLTMTLNGQTMQEPVNPSYSITNENDITLKWTGVPYANSYKVYQMVNGEKVLKSTVTTLSVKYTNMPEGDYDYFIHSYSTLLGESPNGVELKFNLTWPDMAAPQSLTYKIQNGNDVVLTWMAVPYATSYNVYEQVYGQAQKVSLASVKTLTATIPRVASGNHTYVVNSVSSRFGESAEGAQVSFNLDVITMQPPTGLTQTITNGNDITLRWTGSIYATGYNVYQINDGQKVLKSSVTSTAAVYTNMPAGDYTFEVHSVSSRFGESPEGAQISFTLAPVIMEPPANLTQSIANGNDITLRFNASTYANSYKIYQIIDGQKVLKSTVASSPVTYTNMPAGQYRFEVNSVSTRFGESLQASVLEFELVWPVVQSPSLKGDIYNANNITFTWTSVAWANEYRLYEVIGGNRQLLYKGKALTYKIYNLAEDTHYYEVTAYNTRFGESAPSERLVENIVYPVMQPPNAALTLLSPTSARISWDFVVYANGYNVYEIVYGKPVKLIENLNNLSYTLNDLPYVDHEYYVTSYSNSFGESKPSNTVIAKLIVDTEPPVTTADVPADWTDHSPVTVTLSATDNETGVANTYYSINDGAFKLGTSVLIDNEGVTKVTFYSVDKAGNTESQHTIEIKVDKTAPVTKGSDVPAWSKDPVTVTLSATDANSGVAKTLYSVDGSDYVKGNSITVSDEGIHKLTFYSVDVAGNTEPAQTIEVKIDKTAPVTKASDVPAWSKDPVTVTLSATDANSGVAKTLNSVDGSDYVAGNSITVSDEGIHKLTFYSVDVAGNTEPAQTIEVKIDKTAPEVSFNLSEEYELGTTVQLSYSAKDNLSGVAKEEMTVFGPNDTIGKAVINNTNLLLDKPGVYTVVVTVIDGVGLSTTIQKQFVVFIPATIEVTPKVIKGNNGVFTVRVNLPQGYSTKGFDLKTVTLNGVSALTSNNGYFNQAELGQFKFDRSQFNWNTSEVTVLFRGYADGYLVIGQTTVKVQK